MCLNTNNIKIILHVYTKRRGEGQVCCRWWGGTRPSSWCGGAGRSSSVGWSCGRLSPFGDSVVGARRRSCLTLMDGGGSLSFRPIYW
jgi:hypothetical protein